MSDKKRRSEDTIAYRDFLARRGLGAPKQSAAAAVQAIHLAIDKHEAKAEELRKHIGRAPDAVGRRRLLARAERLEDQAHALYARLEEYPPDVLDAIENAATT